MTIGVTSSVSRAEPLVTVVIATYDRSNVLRHAIDSVRHQTVDDWEIVVVGDACTDDTEAVVASFADERIRFVSLGRNFGEQSAPNTVGALLGRGRLIAYLNHDDLWFPWHLEEGIAALERSGADLVTAQLADLRPPEGPGDEVFGRVRILGPARGVPLEAVDFVPASAWLLRRTVIETLGGWRPARGLVVESSHDVLFRALHAGFHLEGTGHLSVVAVPSGARGGSYAHRRDEEHRLLVPSVWEDPERVLADLTGRVTPARDPFAGRTGLALARARLYRGGRASLRHHGGRLLVQAGVNPRSLRARLRGRRPGEFITRLRATRGLPAAYGAGAPEEHGKMRS